MPHTPIFATAIMKQVFAIIRYFFWQHHIEQIINNKEETQRVRNIDRLVYIGN